MVLPITGSLIKDSVFLCSRGNSAANGLENGKATGVTNGVRSAVKGAETLDSAARSSAKVKTGLHTLTQKLSQETSEDAVKFISKSAGFLKGFGVGANIIHAGGIAIDEAKKSGDWTDGVVIGSSSVGGMYLAEKVSMQAYDKGMPKLLSFLGKVKLPKGLNTILKTATFIAASFIGTDIGLAVGRKVAN